MILAGGDSEPQRHGRRLAATVADVLVVCGATRGGSSRAVYEAVKKSFGQALHEVASLALDFQRITGEVVVSRDLVVMLVEPSTSFDPATMDDEWAAPKSQSGTTTGRVLCTTQAGLRREERRAGSIEAVLLLKPKVALTDVLQQL